MARKQEYLGLIEDFIKSSIDGTSFQERFLAMRREDLDRDARLRAEWARPYDSELRAQWEAGRITSEEFERRWRELWGYSHDYDWVQAFEEAFILVERFEPDPLVREELNADRPGSYLSEDELRQMMGTWLRELRAGPPSADRRI